MVRLPRVRYVNVLGAHLPSTVLGLVALTAGATIVGVLAGKEFLSVAALIPEEVFRGQLWRLLTWTFMEPGPISLIFSCLLLAMLGRDLSQAWGYWRFVGIYLGFVAAIGATTCLLALLWPPLRTTAILTAWAMVDAMAIAWATQFPSRQIFVYFVIPVGGRNLIYLTVAGTALFAIFSSFAFYVPHFIAIAFMLVYARSSVLDVLWLRLRLAMARTSRPRHSATLRVVPKEEDKPRWLH